MLLHRWSDGHYLSSSLSNTPLGRWPQPQPWKEAAGAALNKTKGHCNDSKAVKDVDVAAAAIVVVANRKRQRQYSQTPPQTPQQDVVIEQEEEEDDDDQRIPRIRKAQRYRPGVSVSIQMIFSLLALSLIVSSFSSLSSSSCTRMMFRTASAFTWSRREGVRISYNHHDYQYNNNNNNNYLEASNLVESFGCGCCSSRQSRRRISSTVLYLKDGKKKRKKSSASDGGSDTKSAVPATSTSSSSSSSSTAAPSLAPPRVSSLSNIPIRHQIKMVQLMKQAQQEANNPSFRRRPQKERTAYRRTWDEEELELKAEERKRRGQDPNWDVILNQTAAAPLLIVDGYNIIHKWSRLKKHLVKGDSARARQLLTDDLETLRAMKGWRIEVVFDGTKRSLIGPLGSGPGGSSTSTVTTADQVARKDVSKHGVRVVYTGVGIEADSYIESRCAAAKTVTDGTYTGTFIVATDDGMIRLAAQNAGAMCMSADRFVTELKGLKKAVQVRLESTLEKMNRAETLRVQQQQQQQGSGAVAAGAPAGAANGISGSSRTTNGLEQDIPQLAQGNAYVHKGIFRKSSFLVIDKRKKVVAPATAPTTTTTTTSTTSVGVVRNDGPTAELEEPS